MIDNIKISHILLYLKQVSKSDFKFSTSISILINSQDILHL